GGGAWAGAWLARAGLRILGRGSAGPANAKAIGLEAARRALDAAILAAFDAAGLVPAPVDVACLGLAGFDRPEDRRILAGWDDEARWADRLGLVNDGDLVGAGGGPRGGGGGGGCGRRPRARGGGARGAAPAPRAARGRV